MNCKGKEVVLEWKKNEQEMRRAILKDRNHRLIRPPSSQNKIRDIPPGRAESDVAQQDRV